MSHVTLIRPRVMVAVKSPVSPTCPPIGLAYVAAKIREQEKHKLVIIDALGDAPEKFWQTEDKRFLIQGESEAKIYSRVERETEYIGISCMYSYEWPHIRSFIKRLRDYAPEATIVLGGEHASALPEFCLKDCPELDVCVIGEGEETMVEIVENQIFSKIEGICYREGDAIYRTAPRQRIKTIDQLPKPAWDLFPLENYLGHGYGRGVNRGRNMPILSSRGCPYRCTFCSNESMWSPRWIARDPKLLVEEIREYIDDYAITNFDFYDLTTIINRSWTVELCNLIIDSGLKFTWQLASGTRSEAIDFEVATLLKKAGCSNITFAPESGSNSVLKRIQKKVDLTKMIRAMKETEKSGVYCKANIVIGFPGETHREVWASMLFCARTAFTGLHDLSVYPFSPYPGSALFNDLRNKGKIPEINDEYFYTLALSTELASRPPSFSEHISARALGIYRILGVALFYINAYGFRPWRVFTSIKNILSNSQETLLESALHDRWIRPKVKEYLTDNSVLHKNKAAHACRENHPEI